MSRKIVSQKKAGECRTFGGLRILRDGRLRFSAKPSLDSKLEFRAWRVTYHRDEGVWVYDSANYAANARWSGNTDPRCEPLLTVYVAHSRAVSACFNIDLPADALREAVADLRAIGGGIERWLAPGLEATQQIVSSGQAGNPELVKVIPELLRSLRGTPRPSPGKPSKAAARVRSR